VPACVNVSNDASDCSAAERRLMGAIAAGAICDFADGVDITTDEMDSGPRAVHQGSALAPSAHH
jgi:hypothetical protein